MTWTTTQKRGFALGATLASDRGASLAARGLVRPARGPATALARELADADREARRAWVARTLRALQETSVPHAPDAALDRVPSRALALLATSVSRDVGARWLAGAPLPRAGYAPEPALRTLLGRLVARVASAHEASGVPRARTRDGEPA